MATIAVVERAELQNHSCPVLSDSSTEACRVHAYVQYRIAHCNGWYCAFGHTAGNALRSPQQPNTGNLATGCVR